MSCPLCEAANQTFRLIKKSDLAFCTVNHEPLNSGHVMVLPIRHVTTLCELSADESKDIFLLIHEIKEKINELFEHSAIIEMNTGEHGSQEHLHFHILPSKGGLRRLVSKYEEVSFRERASEEKLQAMKQKLIE